MQLASSGDTAASIGLDDSVRLIKKGKYSGSYTLSAQAKGVGLLENDQYVIATQDSLTIYLSGMKKAEIKTSFTITTCSSQKDIIVVGAEDNSSRVYDLSLKEKSCLKANRASISALAISSDTEYVAVGDSAGKIILYSTSTGETVTSRWAFHVARITGLSFSADNKKVISASLDTHVYVWSVDTPTKKIAIKNAHQGGASGVAWLGEDHAISSGSDGALKVWSDLRF